MNSVITDNDDDLQLFVREAVETDASQLLELCRVLEQDGDPTLDEEAAAIVIRRMKSAGNQRIFVFTTADGTVVSGYALAILEYIAHNGARAGVMEDVVVLPKFQSKGIGNRMIEHAIGECAAAGCYKLSLSSSIRRERAHAFYEKNGFMLHGYSFHIKIAAGAAISPLQDSINQEQS